MSEPNTMPEDLSRFGPSTEGVGPASVGPDASVSPSDPSNPPTLEELEELATPKPKDTIDTSTGKSDGLDKCQRCGATEIAYSPSARALVCSFCRHSWNEPNANETYGFASDSRNLTGVIRGSGAAEIAESVDNSITIKCQGCGAEVVVETAHAVGAKCHWCRQTLTVNNQVPNGLIPDALVPFLVTHEQAVAEIQKFARARRFFTTKDFKRDFKPETVVGVYLPYIAADVRAESRFAGVGQILRRRYTVTVGSGDDQTTETRYDADEYSVDSLIGFTADDLFSESSEGRSNLSTSTGTNNVINAILPFDLSSAVVYSSHYLTGFTSERRDLDVEEVSPRIEDYLLTISRAGIAKDSRIKAFDRGVRWTHEGIRVDGIRWQALYLPIWLYSYPTKKSGKDFVHFIAVNGQNGRTMGSIPLNHVKATLVSAGAAIATFAASLLFLTAIGE